MKDMNPNKHNESDLNQLRRLVREMMPPANLEDRVVDRLKSEGMIKGDRSRYLTYLVGVAASLLLFFLGALTGRQSVPQIDANQGYLLLLHQDDGYVLGDIREMEEAYSGWQPEIEGVAVFTSSQELQSSQVWVDYSGKEESDEKGGSSLISGFYMIEAPSMEAAVAIARTNPHLKYGGSIELRALMVRN